MPKITASVGRKGKNLDADVRLVQELLNKRLPVPMAPVTVSGKVDDQTIAVIEEIQRRILNAITPDGRIDPGGNTFIAVVTGKNPNGPVDYTSNPPRGDLTLEELQLIMARLATAKAEAYLPTLNDAMREFEINKRLRQAAFIAQVAHESGEFRYMEEIASGAAYEGRKDLGNTEKGDGKRFKGRGPIQLTGRANYKAAGADLNLKLEDNPTVAATPEVGFRTAGWFWKKHDLNSLADNGRFKQITKVINGGYNGLTDREKYYKRALLILSTDP